nr:hypothetical protein [Tanacetum cinerariifolium]
DQDRATIDKSSTLPHDSAPRVTSPAAEEGREAAAEKVSIDSEEIARVLTSLDATNVLAGESNVPTGSGSIPTAEEEIQAMIDSLDKSNETVAKYLYKYQQFASDLSLEKKIELISDLVKYQD